LLLECGNDRRAADNGRLVEPAILSLPALGWRQSVDLVVDVGQLVGVLKSLPQSPERHLRWHRNHDRCDHPCTIGPLAGLSLRIVGRLRCLDPVLAKERRDNRGANLGTKLLVVGEAGHGQEQAILKLKADACWRRRRREVLISSLKNETNIMSQ